MKKILNTIKKVAKWYIYQSGKLYQPLFRDGINPAI